MKQIKGKLPTLSVCMIVKNEEAFLGRCLKSVVDHVDEIIIVDTGSTDRTVGIAKSFGARIYYHSWQDDFSLHRNQSISYAKGRWIFIIDADEEYSGSSQRSLREEVALADKRGIEALSMRVENSCNEGKETVCLDSIRIFLSNGRIRYEGIVHNYLLGFKNHAASSGRIIHYGYDQGPEAARKKFERTATLLQKQIEENPENALAHLYLSNSYASMNRNEEALRESLTTVELVEAQQITHKQFLKAYYTAARSYIQLQRPDEAEIICRRALDRYGGHIDIFATQTLISLIKNDWSGVIESGGKYREALERYRKHEIELDMVEIATYSEEWKICCWMGMAKLGLGDLEGAETLYARALEITPDKSFLCRQAGISLSEAGHPDRARLYMEEAHRLSPPSNEDTVRNHTNGSEQAPEVASTGLRISPDNSESFFSKAMALEKAGRMSEAEDAYRETIKRTNSHVGAYNNLVGILLRQNEDHEALRILQTASDAIINHPAIRYTYGLVHSVLGNHAEALGHFDKTLQLAPAFKKVNIQKAIIFLKFSKYNNAIDCLKMEIANSGDIIPALITLGEISLHLGDSSQALNYFHKAISIDSDNITAKKHIHSLNTR
ncbi:MAG: glycosyltransferase [Clostridia bacterium]|nr:glycosyltransferase [Clostridia bacterium]